MKLLLFGVTLILLFTAACGGNPANSEVKADSSINVSGTYKGQMRHDPLFPAIDFNTVLDITQLEGSGDIFPIQATLVREATECWTALPVAMHGDLILHRDSHSKITLREVALQNKEATVLIKVYVNDDLKSATANYNSIVPDRKPCEGIADKATLSR